MFHKRIAPFPVSCGDSILPENERFFYFGEKKGANPKTHSRFGSAPFLL